MTVRTQIPPIVRHLRDRDSAAPLREENSRLKTDVSRLRIEKAQLREENSQLRTENSQLKTENSRLKDELYFTHEELKEAREISDSKDIELAKNNTLYHILQDEHLRLASF
jgi:predicted RNase H-like nuclease (RuvC/YqgF family)